MYKSTRWTFFSRPPALTDDTAGPRRENVAGFWSRRVSESSLQLCRRLRPIGPSVEERPVCCHSWLQRLQVKPRLLSATTVGHKVTSWSTKEAIGYNCKRQSVMEGLKLLRLRALPCSPAVFFVDFELCTRDQFVIATSDFPQIVHFQAATQSTYQPPVGRGRSQTSSQRSCSPVPRTSLCLQFLTE